MATTYTGSSTAGALAPSVAPEAEGTPAAQLPADGEAANVASIHQALKVPMDWIAFALKPHAKPSEWEQPIIRWRNARQQSRFGIDHLGFPSGRLVTWLETWRATFSHTMIVGVDQAQTISEGWNLYYTRQAATGAPASAISIPDLNWSGSRYLRLEVGDDVNDYVAASGGPQARFFADNAIAMDFDMQIVAADASKSITIGFNPTFAPLLMNGAILQFQSIAGGVWNWQVGNGTVSAQASCGVTPDAAWHRYRVEWHGAGVDDASVARAVFFIDGVEVGNHTGAELPHTAANPVAWPKLMFQRVASGGSNVIRIGPVRYGSNTWQDAFL